MCLSICKPVSHMPTFNLMELVKWTKCDLFPNTVTKKLQFKRLKTKITLKLETKTYLTQLKMI